MDTRELYAALGGGGLAGVVLKLIDHFYQKKHSDKSFEVQLRDELHKELGQLKADMKSMHTELADWRTRYFQVVEERGAWKMKYEALEKEVVSLKNDLADVRADYESMAGVVRSYTRISMLNKDNHCPASESCPVSTELKRLTMDILTTMDPAGIKATGPIPVRRPENGVEED